MVETRGAERCSCPRHGPSPQRWPSSGVAARGAAGGDGARDVRRPSGTDDSTFGTRLDLLPATPGQQHEAATVGYVAAGVPLLGAPSFAGSSSEAIDGGNLILPPAARPGREEEGGGGGGGGGRQSWPSWLRQVATAQRRVMEELDRVRRLVDRSDLTQLWNRWLHVVLCQEGGSGEEGAEEKEGRRGGGGNGGRGGRVRAAADG